LADNTSAVTVEVVREADLAVGIDESVDPVVAGSGPGNLIYTVTLTNGGPSSASLAVRNLVSFPAGVVVDSVTPSDGSFSGQSWILSDFAAGGSATLTFVFTVDDTAAAAVDAISLFSTVIGSDAADPDTGDRTASEATSIEVCPVVVTTTADSGAGSLRDAIACARDFPSLDTVSFAIAGEGPHTIQVLSALPFAAKALHLDGTSQPGYAGTPLVVIDGQLAGAGVRGLLLVGTGSRVEGLAITGFSGNGIVVAGSASTGNAILGNSLYGNGALGIDLGGDGVTPDDAGDADTGPNRLQNRPVFSGAVTSGGSTDVSYLVDSDPANSAYPLRVEIFLADADGEEGETFLGFDEYTEADHQACGASPCPKTLTLGALPAGAGLVATATDADGNTSEFSLASAVLGATKAGAFLDDGDGDGVPNPGETLRFTVTVTNAGTLEAAAVTLEDLAEDHAGTSLVAGSVTTSQGTVTSGNTAGDTDVEVALGALA
ncbi:MAG: DUF11 domain-containing protein, partial [Acidobacteria bacterium]|nr:DUF11 domain-containing protein [Acidobacteriota bacterium]